ncbi:MAG: DNA polymerase I [Candidatus Omnitrophota bacterium]
MPKPRLFLLDATAFCYRAFYAIGQLNTSYGQPTNAVYGFVNILNKILKEQRPDYLAACFDVSRDTFRQKKFAQYKIQRPPMADGLVSQVPLIKEIVRAYGIPIFERQGYEADDIIASLASQGKKEGLAVVVVSSDKDMLQVIEKGIEVFNPYKDGGVFYDEDKVRQRFGLGPDKITDIIALMGDAADNIPGVPGIGEKTAVSLIEGYGSVDNLLGQIDKIKQEKIKEALAENKERIKLNKELAVLDKNIEGLDFNLNKVKLAERDYKELFRIFSRLEFRSLLKGLPVDAQEKKSQEVIALSRLKDASLSGLLRDAQELVVFGKDFRDLVFYAKGAFFSLDDTGKNLKAALANPELKKIGHNLKELKVALGEDGIILSGVYFDTMIAAYLINPVKTHYSLRDIAWDYLGKVTSSEETDNKMDADLIIKLMPILKEQLREKSLLELFYKIEMPLVEVLSEMELAGISLDASILKELSGQIEKKLVHLIEDIYALSGCQFNINSPKQLRDILFERLKLPVIRRSKTGPSTDERVLNALSSRHKLPALLLEYRQLMKIKTTYVDVLPDLIDQKTGRIHTSFNQTATETGRLSSTHPNLQNIPIKTDIGRNIRRAIVASGRKNSLLSGDYSQIELRILAHLSGDEGLISAFKEGQDIHRATAALIYGVDETDVSDEMRDVAKRVNFGIIYGLTSYGLSKDLDISLEAAGGFIDAYFIKYPRVKEYIEKQIKKAAKDGFVSTISGRRRYLPDINSKNTVIRQLTERQAVNSPIQGSASDLIKLAMINIQSAIKAQVMKAKMILQVHDELIFDVPQEEVDRLIVIIKDKMEGALSLDIPIKVDIKKGRNWLEMESV